WHRFASVIGIDSSGVVLPVQRANSSLGLAEAEFLRRLNAALPEEIPNWFYTWNVKRILAQEVLNARPRHERLAIPPGHAAWVREQAEIVVAGLRDSKYHIVGDLDELLPRPAAGGCVAPEALPAEQLLDVAVQAAAALVERQYRNDIITNSRELAASLREPGQGPTRPSERGPREMARQLA